MSEIQYTLKPYQFSTEAVFKEALAKIKGAKLTFILSHVIIYGPFVLISSVLFKNNFILTKIMSMLIYPMLIGLFMMGVKRAVDRPIRVRMIFHYYRYFFKLMGLFLITSIVFYLGIFVLLFAHAFLTEIFIVKPGSANPQLVKAMIVVLFDLPLCVFLALIFYLFRYAPILLIDKKFSIFRSFQISFLGVKQHYFKVFFTCFLSLLISLPMSLTIIGAIWFLPWTFCVDGILYRIIFGVTEHPS